jgi:hypothetical protein
MSFAARLHPEWGFIAVAPSLISTARTAVIAAGMGAIAGALVVLKLVAPASTTGEVSLAVRTLVCTSEVEQAHMSAPIHATLAEAHAARDSPPAAAAQAIGVSAPAETPVEALLEKKTAKRHHVERRYASRPIAFDYYRN